MRCLFVFLFVVSGGPGPPPASPTRSPGMLFPPKAPMGLRPLHDPPIHLFLLPVSVIAGFNMRPNAITSTKREGEANVFNY